MIANGLGTEEKQGLYARSAYSRLQSCFWSGDEISMFTKTGSNSRWLFRFIRGQCQLQMKGCLWHLVMTYLVGAAIAYSAWNCNANLAWVAYGDSLSINTAYGRSTEGSYLPRAMKAWSPPLDRESWAVHGGEMIGWGPVASSHWTVMPRVFSLGVAPLAY